MCVVTGYPHGPRTQLTSQATPPRVGRGRAYARQHTRASRHTERAQDSQSDRLHTSERAPKSHPCLRIATPPGAHCRTPPTLTPLALCPPSSAPLRTHATAIIHARRDQGRSRRIDLRLITPHVLAPRLGAATSRPCTAVAARLLGVPLDRSSPHTTLVAPRPTCTSFVAAARDTLPLLLPPAVGRPSSSAPPLHRPAPPSVCEREEAPSWCDDALRSASASPSLRLEPEGGGRDHLGDKLCGLLRPSVSYGRFRIRVESTELIEASQKHLTFAPQSSRRFRRRGHTTTRRTGGHRNSAQRRAARAPRTAWRGRRSDLSLRSSPPFANKVPRTRVATQTSLRRCATLRPAFRLP